MAPARRWRRRGRRAQVSAVATLLGLLLVVTFIANYLTTQLPNQMAANDSNHELLVEDQVAHLSALMHAYSSADALGAQISQPISLGSAGEPPFAGQDGGAIGPGAVGSSAQVNLSLVGGLALPNQGTANSGSFTGKCTVSPLIPPPTGISCNGAAQVTWNFTAGNTTHYTVSGNGNLSVRANFTTNASLISVTANGNAIDSVAVFGDNNTIFVNGTGGATVSFLLIGNNNTVNLRGTGGAGFSIFVLGNNDSVTATGVGTNVAHFYGGHDSFADSGSPANVYFIGYNLQNPVSSLCPYGNVANSDTVSGSGGNVFYINTNYTHAPGGSPWYYVYNNPSASACPFVQGASLSQLSGYGGFVVALRNSYSPAAEVAFEWGAVVYAQPSGVPLFFDPPAISLSRGTATIWLPMFTSSVASEAGTGTSVLTLRLLSVQSETWPASGLHISRGQPVVFTIATPYAAGWVGYFAANPALAGHVACSGPSSACSGPYQPGGPLGQVVIQLPATSVALEFATFSIQLA